MKLSILKKARGIRYTTGSEDRTRLILNGEKHINVCNMSLYREKKGRESFAIVFGRWNSEETHSEKYGGYDLFLHWMLNDSPWSEVFTTKHVGLVSKFGAEVDVTKDVYMVHSAATAMRCGIEAPLVPAMFGALVEEGIEPHLAFMASHYVDGTFQDVKPSNCNLHAMPFTGESTSLEDFRKGFRKEKLKGKTFQNTHDDDDDGTYRGVGSCFSGVGEVVKFRPIAKEAHRAGQQEASQTEKNDSRTVAYKNPFGHKKAGNGEKVHLPLFAKHYAIELKKVFPDG